MPNQSRQSPSCAGQGIGKGIAMTLAKAGADIVVGEMVQDRIANWPVSCRRIGERSKCGDRGQVDNWVAEADEKIRTPLLWQYAGNDICAVDMRDR